MTRHDFTGKSALVTGSAKGIGRGTAEALVDAGCSVTLLDIDGPGLRGTAAALRDAGGDVELVEGDVADPDVVSRAVDAAVDAFGGLDLVVNSAGVVRGGTAEELSVEDWDLQIDTNLKSVFLSAKFAGPHLRERSGVIVSISSVQAFVTQLGVPAYTASKGGIVALTRSLALDFAGDGVRAVSIAPGSVDTPMLRSAAEDAAGDGSTVDDVVAEWGLNHPLGRVVSVDDIANAVLYLTSEEAAMVTGTTLTIDGGLIAKVAVER